MNTNERPFIEMRHISKRFGTVQANDDVSLEVRQGEIVALLGENGSGKSTLMNMLSGIYTPDSGSILLDGKPHFFTSPRDAIDAGIGMVHQHFKLIPVMTARENLILGESHKRPAALSPIDKKSADEKIRAIEERFDIHCDHDKKVYNLSVGEKQTVEILKMLYRGAKALILDEATAVLTPQETVSLFSMMRRMKDEGCAILIISHKMHEVMEISDRVMVMRKGKSVALVETASTTPRELTDMMVGKSVTLEIKREKVKRTPEPVLQVKDLTLRNRDNMAVLNKMSFDLYGGEILGLAGIAGSGQKELCEVIAGLMSADSGSVTFLNENILGYSPRTIMKKGISLSFVPEDRLGMGLAAGLSVTDNVLLKSYRDRPGALLDRVSGRVMAEKIVARYDVSTPSINHAVKKLSGGNIQKVLIGREIESEPLLFLIAYPVRGLDINASFSIYEILNLQKLRGAAIFFVGEDLDVLLELTDRIMVIHDGEIMGIVQSDGATKEDLGLLMLGHKEKALP